MRKFYLLLILLISIAMGAFGMWFMVNPALSLRAVTLTIGVLLMFHGIVEIVSFIRERKVWNISFLFLLNGLLSLGIGGFALVSPSTAETTFIILFAVWLLISAVLQMITAFSIRNTKGWIYLLMLSVIVFIFALLSFFSKLPVAITVSMTIGIFFILQGLSMFFVFLFARRLSKVSTSYMD